MNEAEQKSVICEVGSWIWGTLEGGFNEQQSISQIIVDAVIGMIPLVGDVTAVRDLIAVILRLVEHPEKRKDKLEWLTLGLLLFALIPVIGGAIKGVGKLVVKASAGAGRHAEQLRDIIQLLNRLGEGNAVKFIKTLDVEKYTAELVGHWHKLVQRIDDVIAGALRNARLVIPEGMIRRLEEIQRGIRELRKMGERMIPESLKELNGRLKEIQKHLHEGEWHDIPSSLTSKTREAEARLVEREVAGKKVKVWEMENPPFPPNAAGEFHPVEGWPRLNSPQYLRGGSYPVIASFSGPIHAVKIPGGTKIYRVIPDASKRTGAYWAYKLPKDGATWRKECAVLESWNPDGLYVELTVPKEGIWAWEGRVASQIENDEKAANTLGQFLPGGETQLFIDFTFNKANFDARLEVLTLAPQPTNWTNHMGINVPEKHLTLQELGPNEIEAKGATAAAATGQRVVRAGDREDENQAAGPNP
jgi:hypothetical protein